MQLFGLLVFEVTINSKRSTGGRTLVVEYVWVGTTIMIGILQWSSNALLCLGLEGSVSRALLVGKMRLKN